MPILYTVRYFIYFRSRDDRNRIVGYVDNVVPEYREDEFRRMFRLSIPTFETLCGYFTESGFFPKKVGTYTNKDSAITYSLVPWRTGHNYKDCRQIWHFRIYCYSV